jgi:hypothetical protein
MVDRGRVWYGCRPQAVQGGKVLVAWPFPEPHRLAPKTVVWLFDEAPVADGGRYLGQFTVAGAPPQQIELAPSVRLTQAEVQRLQQSAARNGASWALYEAMPADKHEAFAGLSEEQLRAMIPESTVAEYVMDGQLTTLGEVKQRGLKGKVFQVDENGEIVMVEGLPKEVLGEDEKGMYVRQLRDYEESFRQDQLWRSAWIDRMATNTRNRDYLRTSDEDLRRQVQYRQKEHDQLVAEKEKYEKERDLYAWYRNAIDEKLKAVRAAVSESINTNQAMAGEIARIQREATRLIDERTRSMAQTEVGN